MTDLLLRQKMPKFGPSEIFRLRHSLVALVEELKFHKKCELDNESKIQELVTRNHAMHKEWDTERQKARLKEEGFERAIKELKLEYENKLRRLDVDQRQKNVKNECKLFAKDSMKEDMRQLQMTIFHHEKTIKELETKLQAQESSSERAVSQWAGVEDKISNLTEIYQHTLDSVSRLQRDVVQAVSLNQKLSARNHHHECLMQEKVSEMGRLQQELLQVKIEASAPSLDACELQELRGTVGGLHARIHMLETQGQKQNEALTEQTERARLATSNLQTAQQLVTRHLEKAAKHRAEASKLSAECAALTAQCSALKEQLSLGQGGLVERDMAIKTAMEDWQQQASQLQAVITSKDVQLQALEHSRRQLEEANNKLVDSNEQLHQRLVETENTVCVSTSDIGLLAGSSVLFMTDISLQVSPDVRSLATQTSPHMNTTPAQTSPHMNTTPTQNTVDVKPLTSHTSPVMNTVTRYAAPAGNTARATQTSGPPVGHDVHQSHSHETVPSCVQIDAATTCPTSAQTIPPFRANTAAGTAHSFSNNAAGTAHSLTKSLPRVAVDPHVLALASFLDTLQGRHEATIHHTPAQTIQLVSESMTADQTPATLTKSPSGGASDPHASECVQGKPQKYQLEARTSPGSAYAQPAFPTSSMSAHMAHTFTTSQARDGAQYRSADQELLDKCQGQARDGAQYRSADQELLDNSLESHEIVRCLLTAEPTPMFTTKNTPVQDRHQSPPQVDTAGSDFVSSQDKHPAFDNTESSTNITQTAGQYNQEVEQYNQEAAGIQKFDLPISVTLSYTTHIQKDEVKQLTCVDSTRVSHAVAESRTAHGIAEWKQTSPPAPSDMVRHSSQEADRSCSNMGSAVCSSDDRDTAGRDGDFDFVNIKQETCTNQVDVSQTWRDRPSLQGEVCQVDVSQMWCDRPSRQGEVCQVSTNMSSWCCSSTKDEPSLPHRESQFDGPANTISKFDNNNSGKTDSSETLKMRDNISDDEENITKTVMETLPWPDSTDHDDKINMNIDETLPWPDSTDNNEKINMNIDETLPWPDSIDNNEKINMNSDETLPWPDSTDNDVKMNMEIGETHTWPDRTQDDDKIGIDLSQASILQDSTVHLDKMNVNDTHTSIDGTQDDDKMNVNETHTSTDGTQDDDKMNVNDTHTSIDGTQDDDKMNVNETHTSTDGTHDNNDGMDMNVTMACVLIDKRHDDDDDRINVSETDILTDTTNDDTTARIPVSEGPVFLDGTERWMAAGIFQQTDKPSRISRAAFSDTGNTHPAILDPTQCSHMSLSSGVLNVGHITADNLSVCTTPTSNIPLENVGGDQYLNVVPGDILPTRDCGFGTTRRHAMPIKTPRWHLMRKRVRKISLPQSVFTVNVHPHSSVTADYKIIYDHDGTASIQESSLPAQTDSNVTASRRAQVSDIADNCVTAVESLHSSRACVAMGVPAPATSYIQHPTSYVANVSGSAGLSHLAEHTVSSKQAKKLTQNASRPDQGQARDPYDFSAAEDVWSVPGSKLDAPASNQGRTRDVYAFHTAENLVSSQTAKRTSSDTRAAPRSLRLAKPGRISGTRSLACLKSPLLLSLGVSSSMVTRTEMALSNTPSPDVAPSNTSSPVLLKSQPLARAADALMPSQVHVETEPSSCSRMVCDMAGPISRLQCSQQTSSAGSANCQQLLSNQSSQHVTDETSQHLTTLTSQVLTNQTSSCGSHISDNCSSQIKSSDTVTTSSLVCRGNEKTSAENSPDDHTNPPPESSQQKGISPESSQQKGISPESSQQKGISPESSQQKGISPESSQQKGISPESSQQKGISPESSQQKGISLESSQVQSQSEHTTQPGEMDRDWPVLLSHTSTARSISHTVVSTRDAVKSDNKLKGILKGPYCRRPKSVPSKCVRFRLGLVQQLKHGLAQDRQPPGTPFQRGVNSSSSCDDIGSSGYNISAPAADPSGSTAKLEVSSQNDPKSRSQHKQGNSTGQATSDTDPKSCSQHKKGNSIGQATSDTDPKSCSQHKKSNFIGQATSDTDPKSCSQHKGNSIGQTTSCYTDPKSSNEHTHGNSSSLATDGDPNTNDQNKYAISSLAMSSHTDHSSTGQRTCGNSSSLATSSHTGPKMSGQYNCDKSHTDHSSTGQHTYDICKSPAAKSDPNPRDRNRYGNCRSLAVPAHVDPSSSSQLTYCNSTYLTNSRSPARPPTVSTSWDPSAPEAWTRPILIVPESPPLQLSSMEQEILSMPEDAPAGSQSPDTILSSQGSPYARTHAFENINSSSRVQNDVQSPAAKKQKIW